MALAALAVATMLATQGCDAEPAAQASAPAHPDMTFAQARTAFQTYITRSDTAAVEHDSVTGLTLVADASWAFAHTQYTAWKSSGIPVQRYVYGTPSYYVPIVSGYPHWFLVDVPRRALGASPDSSVSTLMVFGQSTPGGAFTLDADAALQPGQTMPAIKTNAEGYAVSLSTYQKGLLLQPNLLGATQAAVVDEGPAADAASLIAPGPQTTGLYDQQNAVYTATAKGLQYSWSLTGSTFAVFVLQTTSGSALVLYGMYMDTATEYADNGVGAPIPVPANFKPLLTDPTVVATRLVDADWTYQFAAIDPAASNGKATVIAATGAPTYGRAE